LGFIGSNLALALWRAGAEVTVVDAQIPGCGANPQNLDEANGAIAVIQANISDRKIMGGLVAGQRVIFNLAGEISHTESVRCPVRDMDLNVGAQLHFLETCRTHAPDARIVYASSRQIYGCPLYLPVDEAHPILPVDFNGIHKWTAESYHRLVSQIYGLETVCLRLTNVYGPRQALNLPHQGFISTFVTRALCGQEILVFGDGSQLREMLHVDDAVNAFLAAGVTPMPPGSSHAALNVGGTRPLTLSKISEAVRAAGGPTGVPIRYVLFPAEHKKIDIGSHYADDRRFRDWTQWAPRIEFEDGIAQTVQFYRNHAAEYLPHASAAY
jgi:UDP-glucose 4-epimerase